VYSIFGQKSSRNRQVRRHRLKYEANINVDLAEI
jgi:hypothetical protein